MSPLIIVAVLAIVTAVTSALATAKGKTGSTAATIDKYGSLVKTVLNGESTDLTSLITSDLGVLPTSTSPIGAGSTGTFGWLGGLGSLVVGGGALATGLGASGSLGLGLVLIGALLLIFMSRDKKKRKESDNQQATPVAGSWS